MLGFYDYHHALRFEGFLYAVLDLLCEALLHLKTMAVDVHHAGYLAQSCDVSVGDVCHVSLAIEWQHMVFAHREEVDVLDDDHLVVFLGKECVSQNLVRVLCVSACKHLHGFGHSHRCLDESLTLRVFAQ